MSNNAASRTIGQLGLALVCFTLLAAGVAGIPASDAYAGTWAVESCSLPGGKPAPIEGWQSEADNGGPYTGANNSCPTGGLEAIDSAQWEQVRSTGAIWTYTAPAGSTIAGGNLVVSLTAPQGVAYVATPKNIYGGNVLVNCQFNLACGPSNALGGWIENESVPITHTGGTQMWAVAECVGSQPGANCAQNDGSDGVNALIRISQADIEINDGSTPQGTGFSGTLLGAPATGTADLNFTASEGAPGPGIYTVTVSVDGHALSTTTPNTNGGKCASVGHDASGVPEYTAQEPCPLSEQVNIPINTTGLTDGHHELTVSITDAAGVTATVYDGTITTQNEPVLVSSLGALPGPGTGTGGNGGVGASSTSGTGAPNGTTASESAQLRLGVGRRISRSFAHRAFHLTGRLLDGQGHPIGSATLDVLQQIAGATTLEIIGHAKTGTNGDFKVGVPAGPSRLIEVAYRAFSTDTTYAAQAKIEESVSAGVQINITPRHTNATGTILLTGEVDGPVPAQGVIVDLLVHYRGRWEPFRTPRTDAAGLFDVAYQFQGALGRFPFRAEVPASQADFSFTRGFSEVLDVAAN
ncbi:MAG: hypothetical protein ACLQQB_01100 [Solirubrobacteraceae bacterium]